MSNKSSFLVAVVLVGTTFVYTNCSSFSGETTSSGSTSGSSSSSSSASSSPLAITGTEANVIPVTVGCGYVNEPCVSVTICKVGATLGSSSCTTVNNLLIDTGSYGLRIFSDRIPSSVALTPKTDPSSGRALVECVGYDGGNSDWGPVVAADVYLGNGAEKAGNLPIQIIEGAYPGRPSGCQDPDMYSLASGNADSSGYNGILGVGLFNQDCGSGCVTDAANDTYYACSGSNCTNVAVALANQVANPVANITSLNSAGHLDNNGVILQFGQVADAGATSLTGYAILGIATQTNNTPLSTVKEYTADSYGNFQTLYSGLLYSDNAGNDGAFIDSGSNANYFPSSSLTQCSYDTGFYCPASETTVSAVQLGYNYANQSAIAFNVTNIENADGNNAVFNNIAGTATGYFDWGFPFFLGRTIYVGIENTSSTLGTGPYWGY